MKKKIKINMQEKCHSILETFHASSLQIHYSVVITSSQRRHKWDIQDMLRLNITVNLECQFFRTRADGTLKWGKLCLWRNICWVHGIPVDPPHRRVFHSFCRKTRLQHVILWPGAPTVPTGSILKSNQTYVNQNHKTHSTMTLHQI